MMPSNTTQKTLKNRTIFCRDNLEVLRGINSHSIDLIYLDPPFNKKKVFTAPTGTSAEGASFHDYFRESDMKEEWLGLIAEKQPVLCEYLHGVGKVGHKSNKYYVCYMAVRLLELHRVLKDTGSLYLHCDTTMSHFLKLLLDCIFGEENFRNEIIWHYKRWTAASRDFQRMHDVLLRYAKTRNFFFKKPMQPFSDKTVIAKYQRKVVEGRTVQDTSKHMTRDPEKGVSMSDVWEIPFIHPMAKERIGYPTQKPIALLERIIKASSPEGGLVLDPFCGCATTCVAAEKLGRQWVGIDISEKVYPLVQMRLNKEVGRPDELFPNEIIYRTDTPERTDTELRPEKLNKKHYLYGKQDGLCAGCKIHFGIVNLTLAPIVPTRQGGGQALDHLQLLCGNCSRIKGDRSMEGFKRFKLGVLS